MHAAGTSFDDFCAAFYQRWDDGTAQNWHRWSVHTNPNAQIVAAALLWGNDDFSTVICQAVAAGADTDCNGATAGSLWGIRYGYESIPRYWLDPLHDTLRTNLESTPQVSIAKLADEMVKTALDSQP
jgi:hypothetical protein